MKHWYCFSFQGITKTGDQVFACTYVGYDYREPLISKSEIYKQRDYAGITNGVLIGVSYLGYGQKADFDDV